MIPHIDLTDDQRINAAYDAYLCQNLMARFVSAQELGLETPMFDHLWSSGDDISFGINQGFYMGRDSVKAFWCQGRTRKREANLSIANAMFPNMPHRPGDGELERRNLMSPLIEIARDGQTAKGMWYCPGVGTQTLQDGQIHLRWHYVRYGVDFILEPRGWRIWHLFEGSEFAFEMGHGYIPATGMNPLPDATCFQPAPEISGLPLGEDVLPTPDLMVTAYSIAYGWSAYPPVPVPYETFSKTFTYGPQPFTSQI